MHSSTYSFSRRSFSFLISQLMCSSCSDGQSANVLIPTQTDNLLISSSHYSVSIYSYISSSISESISWSQSLNQEMLISPYISIIQNYYHAVKSYRKIWNSGLKQKSVWFMSGLLLKYCILILQLKGMDWKNKPNQIFNKVKQQMYSKGVENFHYVDQFIKQFDPNFTKTLTSHFFNLFLNKIGVFLSTQQIRNIRDLYGKSKDQDLILYLEFLQDVKYSFSEKIAALVNQAFEALDSKKEKGLKLQVLVNSYNPNSHPHSLTRKKDPETIKQEFVHAISTKADNKGIVAQAGFVDYYAQLNFCIPNERQSYFEQLIIASWNLQKPSEHVSQDRLKEIELTLYEKIRLKSDGKTNQWKTGKKALSYFDLADGRYVNFQNFKRGLDKFGCNFKEYEMQVLFNKYANEGTLDYETFVKEIMQIDINGMISKPNLLQTKMGTNHFTVTH